MKKYYFRDLYFNRSMKYKVSEYAKLKNVTYRTVWNWVKSNRINYQTTNTGGLVIVEEDPNSNKEVAVYARVSSSENKDNLERQKNRLLDYCASRGYKVSSIVTEIGSGLNDKRPKLEKILTNRSISIIVVEHRDRLSRFGFNYIEKLLNSNDRRIEVINEPLNEKEDLIQDFVSIITSFTARLYGQRRSKRKTEFLIKNLQSE